MRVLARLFFWGYTLMLLGVGVTGMLIATWELPTVFAVALDAMGDVERATLLNQYRFLKALEFAFGLFCVAYRHEIFTPGKDHRVFLGGLSAGAAARLGSCFADGTPRTAFIVFMALELVTGLLVWLAVQRKRLA